MICTKASYITICIEPHLSPCEPFLPVTIFSRSTSGIFNPSSSSSSFVHTSIKVELVWASPPAPASLSHSPSLLVLTQRRPEGKCSRYPSPSWLPLLLPMLVLVPAPPDPLLSLNPAAGILLNKAEHGKSGIGWNEYNPATPLYVMSQWKWDLFRRSFAKLYSLPSLSDQLHQTSVMEHPV